MTRFGRPRTTIYLATMTFGENVQRFYRNLEIGEELPAGVGILHPYRDDQTMELTSRFFKKYYGDNEKRVFLIGINPGRFGGGVTGVAFTDPISLEERCGIPNALEKRAELSSRFMYQMIDRLGGPELFYSKFFFTSVSPLGFVKEGKNLNYYDIPKLEKALEAFMVRSLKEQIAFGAGPVAYSIGQGKNIAYLKNLNRKHKLFEEIRPLPHPRWIMQYRLKRLDEFVDLYKEQLYPWFEAL